MDEKFYKPKEVSDIAGVTVRTLQYYDKIDLLRPSYKNENGYRFYSEKDLMELRKIISLKFLGFSIEDIKNILVSTPDENIKKLKTKKRMLEQEIRKLTLIDKCLENIDTIEHEDEVDWCEIANHLKKMRIDKHKEECIVNVKDKRNHSILHGELMGILMEILKGKGEKEEEAVERLRNHMNMMVKGDNGIEMIVDNLEEIKDMPGAMRGITAKDAISIIDKINKYR